MKEPSVYSTQPFFADHQWAKKLKPGGCALHPPAPSKPPQRSPILRGQFVRGPRRNARCHAASGQPHAQGMAVIVPVRHQALGSFRWAPWFPQPPDGHQNHPLCVLNAKPVIEAQAST